MKPRHLLIFYIIKSGPWRSITPSKTLSVLRGLTLGLLSFFSVTICGLKYLESQKAAVSDQYIVSRSLYCHFYQSPIVSCEE